MASRPKRPKVKREADLVEVAALKIKGYTSEQIARQLEVSPPTVCRDLKLLHQRWRESSLRDFDADRGLALAKLDMLESSLWESWESSKGDRQTITEQLRDAGLDADGKPLRSAMTTKTEQRHGDPAYAMGILRVINERNKILGLHQEIPVDNSASDTLKSYLAYISNAPDSPEGHDRPIRE